MKNKIIAIIKSELINEELASEMADQIIKLIEEQEQAAYEAGREGR